MYSLPALRRGDDRKVLIGVSLSSGTLVGSQSVRCTIKKNLSDADDAAMVRLSIDDGTIEIVDGTHLRLIFAHDAMQDVEPGSAYVDVQVVALDGTVETLENLDFNVLIRPDVTRTIP